MSSSTMDRVPWRMLTPTVLIPNVLHGCGQGAAAPAIPIAALGIGASYATAAAVAAMLTVGQLVFALPAGSFVARFNEKRAMVSAAAVTAVGGIGAFFAPTLPMLMVAVFLIGSGVAVFTLARHAWITTSVPSEVRGRTLSLVAGANRLGMLIGPFLAAGTFAATGQAASAFIAIAATSVVLVIVVAVTPFPADDFAALGDVSEEEAPRVFRTMWNNRGVLVRLGLVISIVSTLRTTRRIFVPLVGVALGIDDVHIALIVGFAGALEFSLFYVGGLIIDRMGRLWVAVPTLVAFAGAFFVFAAAAHLAAGTVWFVVAAMVMAIFNGVSGGVVATIGSDLAPQRSPTAFLASWRLMTEFGPSLVPLAIAGLIGTASLGVACFATGVLALVGAALLPRYVRRYLPTPLRRDRGQHRDRRGRGG